MIKNLILLLIFGQFVRATDNNRNRDENSVLSIVDDKLFYKLGDFADYLTRFLADYNDKNLGSSEWGRMLGYDELKPKLSQGGRGLKKMSMSMLPLVFHVGATSTWMLITSIMAAKSVAIGLLLLVFKIAVSSAKVASFFTLLKSKTPDHQSWSPHGHDRSLSDNAIPVHEEWSSYTPEWATNDYLSTGYKTVPSYKESTSSSHYVEEEDTFESQKVEKKHR